MKKFTIGVFLISMLIAVLPTSNVFAEASQMVWKEDGRYVLRIMHGRSKKNNRIPALVLDQVMGIVWTCQNLQDGKPLWVKADLGQNGEEKLSRKKYVVRMLEWQDADLRMPAIVLDIDSGVTWTCQNIIDGKAMWVESNLISGEMKEISREEIGIVKTEK